MKLVSCDGCGVVLDHDKLSFPNDLWNDDGSIDQSKAKFNGDEWVGFCMCPVCEFEITWEGE